MEWKMEWNGMSRWDEAATPKEQPRRSMAPHAVIWEGCHAGCPSQLFTAILNSVKRTCTLDMEKERVLELDGLKQMRSARFNTACASCADNKLSYRTRRSRALGCAVVYRRAAYQYLRASLANGREMGWHGMEWRSEMEWNEMMICHSMTGSSVM